MFEVISVDLVGVTKGTSGYYVCEVEETMLAYGISMRSGPAHLACHVHNSCYV